MLLAAMKNMQHRDMGISVGGVRKGCRFRPVLGKGFLPVSCAVRKKCDSD